LKYVKGLREEVAEAIVTGRNAECGTRSAKSGSESGAIAISAVSGSPPYEGGVAAASADGVVLSLAEINSNSSFGKVPENYPPAEAGPLLRKEGSLFYTSVDDLISRVPQINRKEVRALSLAGALNFDNSHRRQALWESELAIQPRGELFKATGRDASVNERASSQPFGTLPDGHHPTRDALAGAPGRVLARSASFIKPMSEWQRMESDLITTGITIGKHPMSFLREDLKKAGIISAEETFRLSPRDIVTVAGSVIVRQRPSTAKDVVFMTMEDETGYSNFLILPDVFDKFRSIIVGSNFLIVRGIHEQRGMIKALYFQPINAFISKIASHDFQ
jgi:error-prone DNA polymerase